MSRNGNGLYNLPAGNPVVTGSTISSTWANTTFNDVASALTLSIASDGQTTPSANLPMGGFAHTNIANATVRNMYASAGQVQDGAFLLLSSITGTNSITAIGAAGVSAYVAGQAFRFVSAGANTGAVTLNINAIGVIPVTKNGATALASGDIPSGAMVQVVYDGTQFQLMNVAPSTSIVNSFSAGTTGLTPSTDTTGAVTLSGTLAVKNGGTGLATLTANNVILGNGTSAVQAVAPGTSGNVLTSNGTTWLSTALPASGGMTLLGTLTTTSGASQALTGLTLTGYKNLQLVITGVSGSSTGNITYAGITAFTTTASSDAAYGIITISLDNGWGYFIGNKTNTAISSLSGSAGPTGLTTASTSVTVSISSGTFDAGSVLVYGVR